MLVEAFLKGCPPNIKAYIDMQRVLGTAPTAFQKVVDMAKAVDEIQQRQEVNNDSNEAAAIKQVLAEFKDEISRGLKDDITSEIRNAKRATVNMVTDRIDHLQHKFNRTTFPSRSPTPY
uniref:Uncharacterized protein n=1 Tax=Acrobeloides nanus TaxID=290746 RepID=A0A914DLZ9_9BILA